MVQAGEFKDMSLTKRIDNKHSLVVDVTHEGQVFEVDAYVAKRMADGTFQRIPEDEPVIVFRGRDKLALPMLEFYRQLCVNDGCVDFQLTSMDDMIARFKAFAAASPTMKQPGVTRGL